MRRAALLAAAAVALLYIDAHDAGPLGVWCGFAAVLCIIVCGARVTS
jgi:hypothetical protein